ncbi:hypothetical protein DMB90_11500 [Raoultella planticola]|uniref:Uncharacterized protein n=1 Tax=Raoultella planticola TaxID=575 RepID=A0A5P6AAN6_RAOPL|nr:hypothetical protein DMB90_11500 [Raoultella planticola]
MLWVTIVSECEITWVINMPELTLVDATGENGLRLCRNTPGFFYDIANGVASTMLFLMTKGDRNGHVNDII